MASLVSVIELLPWHIHQRLVYAVNVDLQNDVSAQAAAEPPEAALDTDSDEQPALSTASGSADVAAASSHAAPMATQSVTSGAP